jgi:hypothetical protein
VTFARLSRADWLAFAAALVLLLVMSLDWYSTQGNEEAQKEAQKIHARGPSTAEAKQEVDRAAKEAEHRGDKNAWQASASADRLVLFALLVTIALAIAAAFMRAADKRLDLALTPSALTAIAGLGATLLLTGRILQKPSAEAGAVIKLGAPLGLVCVGVLTIAARAAWNGERGVAPHEAPGDAHPPPVPAEPPRPAPLFDYEEPPDATAATATAVRPVLEEQQPPPAEPQEEWAPDWSDQAAPAPEADAEEQPAPGRRRRRPRNSGARSGRNKRRRRS